MKENKVFGVLQRVGRSFMLPIAILPVAGLLLGIGGSFTDPTAISSYGLESILGPGTLLHHLLLIMKSVGAAIFSNLPIIFAMGVAIGMAKKEKEVAALAAAISYFVMNVAIHSMLTIHGKILPDGTIAPDVLGGTIDSTVGILSLQMGVFGGIIVGLGVAALHNRFYRIELPNALSFFSGSRFVPIISTLTYLFVGILMYFVWPPVQNGIYALGGLVTGTGYAGTLIFGLIKRALIPFGLHHVFYLPFWQTAVGGSMEVAGKLVQGGQNIFFAQLADPSVTHFSSDATRYFSGEFIFMIFGLPGAALAMYRTALPEKKKVAGGLLLSAALTCMLTGITEPIEFSFLFVAPMLFGVQVLLAGAAYMIAHMLNIAVGLTFSGGLIDLFLFGILQGNDKTSWLLILPVGIVYFFLYYFIFSFLIKKFDLKTPGREVGETTKLYTKKDVAEKNAGTTTEDAQSSEITLGLGGAENIVDVDSCATRLRCTVKDASLVRDDILKASGAMGVVKSGNGIQVIYGPRVSVIKTNLEEYLSTQPDTPSVKPNEVTTHRATPEPEGLVETKNKTLTLTSPMEGELIPLSEVPDPAFASETLGKGFAIRPANGKVYSPLQGSVTMVFDSLHALGLTSSDGAEVLIHVGMDTVNLKGEGFHALVKTGDPINVGTPLLEFDPSYIESKGYSTVTPVVLTNSFDYKEFELLKNGSVHVADKVFEATK